MGYLPCTEAELTTDETDESRFESLRIRKCGTRFEQEFKFAVIQYILVGMAGGQRLPVAIRPLVVGAWMVSHLVRTCVDEECVFLSV